MNTNSRLILILLFGFIFLPGRCQKPGVYTLTLTDKKGSSYSIDHPEAFLTTRSLQRRIRQHVPVTFEDLPVSEVYADSLRALGMEIYCRSRWLNTITAYTHDTLLLDTITRISFVKNIRLVKPDQTVKSKNLKWLKQKSLSTENASFIQLGMLHGDTLHQMGFTGKGMLIAVLDAGFYRVDVLPAFDSLWSNGQIKGTRDFVDHNKKIFEDHTHGMNVLSILAGNIPGQLIGSAPGADYWLLRTEDVYSEYPLEEEYWTAGAEFADSVGADIIHSSLGYNVFDDPSLSHTYQDMNGRNTTVAKAAIMAARRGMIVVVSAGNEGNKPWHYIISPADADSILAVGAVDALRNPASFTSYGPSSDKRVKPDVSALGVQVLMQGSNGSVIHGNGTSFSSPLISGLTACLWQAFSQLNAQEIIRSIRTCADHFRQPDDRVGYGIPDYLEAYTYLHLIKHFAEHTSPVLVYPNPFTDYLNLVIKSNTSNSLQIQLYDIAGRKVFEHTDKPEQENIRIIQLNPGKYLPAGVYILQVINGHSKTNIRIVKMK